MGNLIFFISLMVSIIFFMLANKKDNKKIMILGIIILSIIAGFRGVEVGFDTAYYYDAFLRSFPKSWQFEEKGFRIITNFLMDIFNNHATIVFVIYATIINFLIICRLWDFRKKSNFSVMTILYVLIFFIDSMNIMRQFLAISIIFYSTKLLEKKKYTSFLVVVILCTFIHTSSLLAIILLIVYLWNLLTKRNKLLLIIPIICLSVIGMRIIYNYESADINNYLSISNSSSNINLTFIYRYVIFILSYFLNTIQNKKEFVEFKETEKKKLKDIKQQSKLEFNIIAFVYMIGLSLGSLGMFFAFAARIGYYCLIFELLYWGYLTYKNKSKYINLGMIMIYAIYIFSYEILYNGSRIFPYYFNFI